MWKTKQQLPPFEVSKIEWSASKPILAYLKDGTMCIVTVEQIDADCPIHWYSFDSERWDMSGYVTHWTELPAPPMIK